MPFRIKVARARNRPLYDLYSAVGPLCVPAVCDRNRTRFLHFINQAAYFERAAKDFRLDGQDRPDTQAMNSSATYFDLAFREMQFALTELSELISCGTKECG